MKWRCDQRSCDCNLSNQKLSPKNVFGASTGFEPMDSALALQRSTNWAMKTHTMGAGQFIEFIVPVTLRPYTATNSAPEHKPTLFVLLVSVQWRLSIQNPEHMHRLACHWLKSIRWRYSTRERSETYEYYLNCGHTTMITSSFPFGFFEGNWERAKEIQTPFCPPKRLDPQRFSSIFNLPIRFHKP